MRRAWVVILAGLLLGGCASSKPVAATYAFPRYIPSVASALAFDPPVGSAVPELYRDQRGPAAFGGFRETSVEYYDVQTYDTQQYYGRGGYYNRQVLSDHVGVIYR
jgi:hypothetical protein